MAFTAGQFPTDPEGALTGKARVLFGVPGDGTAGTVDVPTSFYGVVNPLTLAAVGSWLDLGLTTDAPTLTTTREGGGLEYQQTGEIFSEVTGVGRQLVIPIGHLDETTLAMIDNTDDVEIVAAAPGVPSHALVRFGTFQSLKSYRFAIVAFRPSGTSPVIAPAATTFPGGSNRRPAMVATVLPLATLALENTEESYSAGDPVGLEATFDAVPVPGLPAGAEHGFRHIERPGQIT